MQKGCANKAVPKAPKNRPIITPPEKQSYLWIAITSNGRHWIRTSDLCRVKAAL